MMQVFGYNTTDAEYQIYINAIERFENYVNNHTRSLNETFSKHKTVVRETAAQAKHKTLQATNQFNYPWDAYRVANGFWNGAVDVFPIKSLQDLCRNNVTETRKTSEDLFVNNRYNLPEENLEYITAFSRLMQKPYGLSFSCLFGLREVFRREKIGFGNGRHDGGREVCQRPNHHQRCVHEHRLQHGLHLPRHKRLPVAQAQQPELLVLCGRLRGRPSDALLVPKELLE